MNALHEEFEPPGPPIKLIAIGTILFLLVLAGLFAVAILIPVEEDEFVGRKKQGQEQIEMKVGANTPIADIRTDIPLGAEEQLAIWGVEHVAFEIEKRFGDVFGAALKSRDAEKLAKFFLNGYSGPGLAVAETKEHKHGVVQGTTRQFRETDGSSSADDVVGLLLESTKKMATFTSVNLRVLSLKQEETSVWDSRLELHAMGKTEDGNSCEVKSTHSVRFEIEDEGKLDTKSSIGNWSVNEETVQFGNLAMMEELDGLNHNMVLRPFDNWRNQRQGSGSNIKQEGVPPHRFQTAVADFDGDGDPDIAVADGRKRVIFRNDNGEFAYATRLLGLRDEMNTNIAPVITWFDFDNDGHLDLLCDRELHRNVDGKKLELVTGQSGLALFATPGAVCPCDFDCDGLVDLFVPFGASAVSASWLTPATGVGNQLWRNIGDGGFENVTETANISGGEGDSTGAVWLFANEDHYPDLFVVNDLSDSQLFINNGDGTFKDVSESIQPTRITGFAGGATSGDIDNDGRPDLYLSGIYSRAGNRLVENVSQENYPEARSYDRMKDLCSGSRLYRLGGDTDLIDITGTAGVGQVGYSWGAAMFDVDNDGWLDLYGASGFRSSQLNGQDMDTCYWRRILSAPDGRDEMIPKIGKVDDDAGEFWAMNDDVTDMMKLNVHSFQRNRLFLNNSGSGFIDASFTSAVDLVSDSRGAIPADFNGDGAVDLLVASVGGGSLRLFLNQTPQGHRVKIRLVGTTSNKFGVGSRVIAKIGDRQVVRDLFPTVGFMSNGPSEIWIGAGEADTIDSLSVRWPTGETQEFKNVSANQSIEITEGNSEITTKATFK